VHEIYIIDRLALGVPVLDPQISPQINEKNRSANLKSARFHNCGSPQIYHIINLSPHNLRNYLRTVHLLLWPFSFLVGRGTCYVQYLEQIEMLYIDQIYPNYTAKTKYRNFETNIPRKGISGSVPISTCMRLWAIYIFPGSVIYPNYTAKTKYRNFETNIPRKGISGSVPISTCMRLWAIYIFPGSVCLFCWRKYVDRSWDWDYINRSQTHECGNWGWGRAIPRKAIYKWDFRCSGGLGVTVPPWKHAAN
jgi:hypothetical protein